MLKLKEVYKTYKNGVTRFIMLTFSSNKESLFISLVLLVVVNQP